MSDIGTSAIAAGIAGKKALELLVGDIYSTAKDKTKKALKRWQNQTQINRLHSKIASVRKVKTLWQVDKPVDLSVFYCESHVLINKIRIPVGRLKDLGDYNHILIEGIAGQGKSIFLRYLCGAELIAGEFIPVFVELRRVLDDQSLEDYILETFLSLGLKLDSEDFRDLARSGRILLLLDGFDEVDDVHKPKMINEIEFLCDSIEDLRVIVSSRRDSGLAMSPLFLVAQLSDLQGDEYQKVIYKLLDDSVIAKQLIEKVVNHTGGLRQLLKTPLMVTLLVLSYKSYQELPAQLSDFYIALFQVLLQRHDGSKPGYTRKRQCSMNDFQYRQVFESFCFHSKQSSSVQNKYDHVYAASQKALEDLKFQVSPEMFLCDILNITCLLVKDGEEYRFIHKSVQEFYAASYIQRKPDQIVKKIYRKLFTSEVYDRWQQEIKFLFEIDSYRCNKYGLLPFLCEFLELAEEQFVGPLPDAAIKAIYKHFQRCNVGLRIYNSGSHKHIFASLPPYISGNGFLMRFFVNSIFSANYSELAQAILKDEKPYLDLVQPSFRKSTEANVTTSAKVTYRECSVRLENLCQLDTYKQIFEKKSKAIAKELYERGKAAFALVNEQEKQEKIVDLIS